MCAAVERFIDGVCEIRLRDVPRPGSAAYADWAAFPKPAHLHAARTQSVICLEVAAEHVEGLVDAIERSHVLIAWSCLRVAIEASASSLWLTTQGIDPTTRVGRGLAVRDQSLSQMLAFVRAAEPRLRSHEERALWERQTEHLSLRAERLESEASSVGLMPIVNKKGRRIGAGAKWPGSTELIERVFGLEEALLYRAASVVVHSNPSALLDFTLSDKATRTETAGLRKAMDAAIAARMLCRGIEAYAKAFWSNASYLGEGLDGLRSLLDALAHDLQMPSERWFWSR